MTSVRSHPHRPTTRVCNQTTALAKSNRRLQLNSWWAAKKRKKKIAIFLLKKRGLGGWRDARCFSEGERCCSHGRAAEGKNHLRACVRARANELIKLTNFFFFSLSLNAKRGLSQIDKLLILFLSKSPLIRAVGLPRRAVSASSHSPSAAHALARLTQEILKTICYFCLIIHINRTSYIEPTRSVAYSSSAYVCFFLLYFCFSDFFSNDTFNYRRRAGNFTLTKADSQVRRRLWW